MQKQIDTVVSDIARNALGLNTLESRNMDMFDFHEFAVWTIKEALEAAYKQGLQDSTIKST